MGNKDMVERIKRELHDDEKDWEGGNETARWKKENKVPANA